MDDLAGDEKILVQPEVVAICDNYPAMMRRSASKVPGATQAEDYKSVLENKDIRAVVIAMPTHQHKDIAVAALQAATGLGESPLAPTCGTPCFRPEN